jgi:hypothetical protein
MSPRLAPRVTVDVVTLLFVATALLRSVADTARAGFSCDAVEKAYSATAETNEGFAAFTAELVIDVNIKRTTARRRVLEMNQPRGVVSTIT